MTGLRRIPLAFLAALIRAAAEMLARAATRLSGAADRLDPPVPSRGEGDVRQARPPN